MAVIKVPNTALIENNVKYGLHINKFCYGYNLFNYGNRKCYD